MKVRPAKNPVSEAQFQERVVGTLNALGYTVWVTSARSFGVSQKKVFALCKTQGVSDELAKRLATSLSTQRGYGADRGIPDLLIRRGSWPRGTMFGAELKGAKTALSVEQRILEAEGCYGVFRQAKELFEALEVFEGLVAGGQPERVRRFIEQNPSLG